MPPDLFHRYARVAIAEYLGIMPAQVDAMPLRDWLDVLDIRYALADLKRFYSQKGESTWQTN